jgi:hypothetical protein
LGEAAVMAIAAGHDLALVCRRRANIEKVRGALGAAVREGLLTRSRLADAFRRSENLTARLAAIAPAGETRAGWLKTLISQDQTE